MNEELIQRAEKRFNKLMHDLCLDHLMIGQGCSEGTDEWNLRDMVAECDYQLSTYYEEGHYNASGREECPKQWRSETGKLRRFINYFQPFIAGMHTTESHCSTFDNTIVTRRR